MCVYVCGVCVRVLCVCVCVCLINYCNDGLIDNFNVLFLCVNILE